MPRIAEQDGSVTFHGAERNGSVTFHAAERNGSITFHGAERNGSVTFHGAEQNGSVTFHGAEPLPTILLAQLAAGTWYLFSWYCVDKYLKLNSKQLSASDLVNEILQPFKNLFL